MEDAPYALFFNVKSVKPLAFGILKREEIYARITTISKTKTGENRI